jgi:D-alanyl-D-alanine carboxypeptidase (penicillin-binding protein 5/6)
MQAEAAHLQARDTTVKNASGLDADGQLSSAYDMALIARAALDLEDFRTVTGALSYDFPGKPVSAGKKRPTYKIYTQNRLLLHGYDGAIGGKTGFTSLAHRTFWGAATRAGHTLVVTLLQIGEPTEAAARKLLDWGFANIGKVTAVGTLVGPVDPDAAAGGTPAPSQSAGAGGTGTTATTPTSSTKSLPWPVIAALGALLVAVVVAALWWRRRHGAAGATTAADESAPGAPPTGSGGSAATDVLPAAAAPRSVRTSSTGSSSVVVRAPGQSSTPRPGPARPVPATTGPPVAALDDTGPLPPVGGSSRPAGRTERPSVPAVELEQPQVGPERARPAPVPGGHVRVISPPSQGTPD